MERTFAGNGYELYDVPILLNGEPRTLQVSYNQSTHEYTIERAIKKANKDGMASRDVNYLKAGDEITPLFVGLAKGNSEDDDENVVARFSDADGEIIVLKWTRGKPFKIGQNPKIEEKMLEEVSDGVPSANSYDYIFIFYAPDGTMAWSDFAGFEITDGEMWFYTSSTEE